MTKILSPVQQKLSDTLNCLIHITQGRPTEQEYCQTCRDSLLVLQHLKKYSDQYYYGIQKLWSDEPTLEEQCAKRLFDLTLLNGKYEIFPSDDVKRTEPLLIWGKNPQKDPYIEEFLSKLSHLNLNSSEKPMEQYA
jgi:hypothetical protein